MLELTCSIPNHHNSTSRPRDCLVKVPEKTGCLPCLAGVKSLHLDLQQFVVSASLIETSDDSSHPFCFCINSDAPEEWKAAAMIATYERVQSHYLLRRLRHFALTNALEDYRVKLNIKDTVLRLYHSPCIVSISLRAVHSDFLHYLTVNRYPHSFDTICPNLRLVRLADMTIHRGVLERFCRSLFANPLYRLSTTNASSDDSDSDAGWDEHTNPQLNGTVADTLLSREVDGTRRKLWLAADVRIEKGTENIVRVNVAGDSVSDEEEEEEEEDEPEDEEDELKDEEQHGETGEASEEGVSGEVDVDDDEDWQEWKTRQKARRFARKVIDD